MKKIFMGAALCLLASLQAVAGSTKKEVVDYVNPLVGTESKFELSTGNTYPAIAMPWGMNFWMPQTGKMGNGWAYVYWHDKIRGFKQTHQPSPWINDYGQFSIMPETGEPVFDEEKRASWFSHKAEVAKPYYYRAYLADYDVVAEMAPTERACAMRFTFPETDKANIVVDAFDRGSHVQVIPEKRMIVGYTTRNSGGVPDNFKNYFVLVFDKPFTYKATVASGNISEGKLTVTDNHAGAIVGFKTRRGEQVGVRIASSFISPEQALLNLNELGNDTFDEVAARGRKAWNDVLGRIEVDDDNIDHLRTFYSCLYRSVLFPRSFYEKDAEGKVMHYSPYNGQVLPGYMFTDTGFWDTFRCLFPFLNMMYPSMNQKMQEGLVNAYLESGFLPEWASPGHRGCMVGNNSASIVADAYMKGLRGYDIDKLWEAVLHGANSVHPKVSSTGRAGFELYNKMGYVPCDKLNQSVARTLEYAYDDWCIYTLGKALGRPEKEIKVYAQRAMNYRNVFDPSIRLMRGKDSKGNFETPFNPTDWTRSFTEGDTWHWTWCVFHDPQGLIDIMGGKDSFNQMMDSTFIVPPVAKERMIHEEREMQVMNMGQYAHGNQPIQHMIYLYNYSGQPWKTQYWIREVMDKLYSAHADGYCGDEDNGQTSAWYVFSALGFYPVCPGTDQYIVGTPYFDEVKLHLENGKTLEIDADNNSTANRYIQRATLNGQPHTKNYFTHADLMNGGKIEFEMGAKPNTQRGTTDECFPYSFSKDTQKKAVKKHRK
ncbi:MAG: GH92 family glycosyl hydrolase [Prevotellaceae bacterium]|nr:GH92 family glycosyl hydrolase [Prevotellaceae bacterium]